MSSALAIATVGCVIVATRSEVDIEGVGFVEHLTVDVEGTDACDRVTVTTTDDVHLRAWSGRVSMPGSDHRLGPERRVRESVGVDGAVTWAILLPELGVGSTARLELDLLTGPATSWLWVPSTRSGAFAELRRPRGITAAATATGLQSDKRWWWTTVGVTPSAADANVLLTHPWQPLPTDVIATLEVPRDEAPTWTGTLTLALTGPRPRTELRPDRPVALLEGRRATWSVAEGRKRVFLPLPHGTVRVVSTDRACETEVGPDAVWITAPDGVASCLLLIERAARDVWGEVPADLVGRIERAVVTWDDRDGRPQEAPLVLEGATWRLAELDGATLLTDRDRLQRELSARVLAASMPEPAVPLHARPTGAAAWELAAALVDVLRSQVIVDDRLDVPATRPRPLHAARDSTVVTSAEAAMILSLYLRQSRVDAVWELVRPAGAPDDTVAPLGYDTALVRVTVDGEVRWLDPACDTCAPFTIRPALSGATRLGGGDPVP